MMPLSYVFCIVISLLFTLQAHAQEYSKRKVTAIKIQGNESTKDYIILNEITFKVGDEIDSTALNYNRDRIYSLGIFNQVNLAFDESDSTLLIISVKEAWYIWPIPFAELVDRDWSKISYGLDVFVKNFRGVNESLRLRAALGYNPGFRLYYDIPYLFRESAIFANIQLQSDLFRNPSSAAIIETGSNFDVKHQSIAFALGKRFDKFRWLSFAFGFDHFSYPSWLRTEEHKDFSLSSVAAGYKYDTRNLIQFPTEGQLFSIASTYRGFGMYGYSYSKLQTEYRNYSPISEKFTFKQRFSYQTIIGNKYPYHDYVFLGYAEKVRGHFSDKQEGDAGIFTSFELNYPWIKDWVIEFDFPLIPKKLQTYQTSIYSYLFLDAANVKERHQPFLNKNTLYGMGGGMAFVFLPYRVTSIELAFNEKGNIEYLFQLDVSF